MYFYLCILPSFILFCKREKISVGNIVLVNNRALTKHLRMALLRECRYMDMHFLDISLVRFLFAKLRNHKIHLVQIPSPDIPGPFSRRWRGVGLARRPLAPWCLVLRQGVNIRNTSQFVSQSFHTIAILVYNAPELRRHKCDMTENTPRQKKSHSTASGEIFDITLSSRGVFSHITLVSSQLRGIIH